MPDPEELDLEPLDFQPIEEEKKSSVLKQFWDRINTPITDLPSRISKKVAEFIDPISGNVEGDRGYVKPFLAGAAEGAGDLASSFTSPLNLATTAAFGGSNLAAKKGFDLGSKGLSYVGKALSAPVAAHGGYNVIAPESTLAERGQGLVELAGGLAGLKSGMPSKTKLDLVPEPVIPKLINPHLENAKKVITNYEGPNKLANMSDQAILDYAESIAPGTITQKPKVRLNLDGTYSPIENPAVKLDKSFNPIESPIQKLNAALKDAIPLNEAQKAIYSAERGERIGKVEDVKTTGLAGHYEKLGKLKGEHTKVEMEPIKLEPADVDSLVDTINTHPELQTYAKMNATTGLTKILSGEVPQKSEIDLLEKVFGKNHIDEMRAALPLIDSKKSTLMEIVNLPRAIQSSFDLSFPFRQGIGLIHTKPWWDSWGSMIKSVGSEKAFRGVMDSILQRPNHTSIDGKSPSFAKKAGLDITDLVDLFSREESMMSTWAEKIPGIRPSNRGYTAFANKLRADNFDSMISQAEKAYAAAKALTPDDPNVELQNPRVNIKLAKEIASYINNASGRGNLGALEDSAVALNAALFSPRLIASRLQMMNPRNYVKTAPQVRKAYLKSLMSLAVTWTSIGALGKLAGAEVSDDTNSSDFGKIKIGNTRLDPAGGFQQYLVLASRLASGKYTSASGSEKEYGKGFGGKTRLKALTEFIQNKLAPVPSYGASALDASEYRPFDFVDRSARSFTPIILQDLSELIQEDPSLIPAVGLGAIGMGTQVYGERGENTKLFGDAQPEFSIPFED